MCGLVIGGIWALNVIPKWQVNALPPVITDQVKAFQLENEGNRPAKDVLTANQTV